MPQFQGEAFKQNLGLVQAIEAIPKKNCTSAQLALAWLLAQDESINPIPGTKKFEYFEENMGAIVVALSPDEIESVNIAIRENPVIGARYPEELLKAFNLK